MTDEYRELQHAKWLATREPLKRLVSADSDDEIRVLKGEQRGGSFEDDEALARRLQAEFDGARAPAAAGEADEDSELARLLQEEEDRRMRSFINPGKDTTEGDLVEPTPDIHSLFRNFNELYFDKKLEMVEVKWGPRMTLCAGLCLYEGKSGGCVIKLSEPILKYRTTKDLIDTLLHEMIHAYLFVAANKRDHEDHGPLFLGKMEEINKRAGTNISVYHNFRDEVDLYRVHWWKCNGKCARVIKRAMNRAPSHHDRWFAEHQQQCGGQFIKIKEPDKKDKGKKPKKAKMTETDITPPKHAELALDRWVRRGGNSNPAPIVGPRISPPPPPLERREVILVSSGETPPASPSSKKRKNEETSTSSKKEEKKVVATAEDSDDDFKLIDRRGSLNRIN